MLYAFVDGKKNLATPGARAVCSMCDGEVIAKCGKINIWHWAHKTTECDTWAEGESAWHLAWKSMWPEHLVEQTIRKNGVLHRADILQEDGTVIELQNSSISVDEIREREAFYDKMMWILI